MFNVFTAITAALSANLQAICIILVYFLVCALILIVLLNKRIGSYEDQLKHERLYIKRLESRLIKQIKEIDLK